MVRVEEYEFGRIVIDGRTYTSDVIVHRDGVEEGWWRKEGHRVTLKDIDPIINLDPEIVVFGKGANSRVRIDREVKEHLEKRNIEVFESDSYDAIKIFESFLRKGRKAVLAIHLTC